MWINLMYFLTLKKMFGAPTEKFRGPQCEIVIFLFQTSAFSYLISGLKIFLSEVDSLNIGMGLLDKSKV